MEFNHKSVLLKETIDGLNVKPEGIYVDGTLGGGGHSYEVCTRLGEKGSIIGIDQDEAAIEAAGVRLKDFGETVRWDHARSGRIVLSAGYGRPGILLPRGCTLGHADG